MPNPIGAPAIERHMIRTPGKTNVNRISGELRKEKRKFCYYDQWLGSSRCIVAPAGTPENVIKFYEDAFQKLMEDADYLKAAEAAGMETDYKNSADTAALIKQQQDFTESLADVWGD